MRIDVHTHFYPRDYLQLLRASGEIEIRRDAAGRDTIRQHGARVVTLTPPMEDIAAHVAEMDRCGIDVAVLSLSIPNVYFADAGAAAEVCRQANESLRAVCAAMPQRLRGWASIPLQRPDLAVQELESALDAGMVGCVLGTNIHGRSLTDSAFAPFFAACNRRRAVIFLHPMSPVNGESFASYALAPLLGFINDTNVAVASLIFDGFFERYPDIRLIIPHLGAGLPYLAGRLDNGFRAYPECREHIGELPSSYLRRCYLDTVSFHRPALECAIGTNGVDKLLLGSDYPHVIGDIERAIASIEDLPIAAEDRRKILGANAARLLGIGCEGQEGDEEGSTLGE